MTSTGSRWWGRLVLVTIGIGMVYALVCGSGGVGGTKAAQASTPLRVYHARTPTEGLPDGDGAGRLEAATPEPERLLYLADPPMQGDDVRELQSGLQQLGLYKGAVSGIFDRSLMEAVRDFQRQHRLGGDGVVGPLTWQALCDDFPLPVLDDVETTPEGEPLIMIDVSRRQLIVEIGGQEQHRFPVAVGLAKTPSPIGEFRIVHKSMNWGGGFGTRWLGLNVPWGIYGIHGTNKPWSIGTMASGGCIRMFNNHVEYLYRIIPEGTSVHMIGRESDAVTRHLKPGSSGQDVITLQLALRQCGCDPGFADGRYGEQTQGAVMTLQRRYGLLADGFGWPDVYLLLGVK